MPYKRYECLEIRIERGVALVTIDHPLINLFDGKLLFEMDKIGKELEIDNDVRVVVFQSANPDFFIAHGNVAVNF